MNGLLVIGGVLGCVGLAVLMVAPRRELRLAGLVGWAVGLTLLGARPRARRLTEAAARGRRGGIRARRRRRRAPAPLAVPPAVRDARLRPGADPGRRRRRRREPAPAALRRRRLAGRRARLAARGAPRPTRRELGPVTLPLAALVAWTGLTVLWTVDEREGAIALGAFVLPFGLLAVGMSRLPVARPVAHLALGRPRRDGARSTRRSASTSGRRATCSGTRR